MALSVGEANAVNTLIRFITKQERSFGPVTPEQALDAANLLARGADRKLMAGFKGNGDVAAIWPGQAVASMGESPS